MHNLEIIAEISQSDFSIFDDFNLAEDAEMAEFKCADCGKKERHSILKRTIECSNCGSSEVVQEEEAVLQFRGAA